MTALCPLPPGAADSLTPGIYGPPDGKFTFGPSISDEALADELIARLNKLCDNPSMLAFVGSLIEVRVGAGSLLLDHPTIQCTPDGEAGFLGVLNGLVGAQPSGKRMGWGYIAANFDDEGHLTGFFRTPE